MLLQEVMSHDQAQIITEVKEDNGNKNLYMKGIFLQGGIVNRNQRMYPVNEISSAVNTIMEQINSGFSVLGELDHPKDRLEVEAKAASHLITEMWMDGSCGYGKLKILPTPQGQVAKALLENGVKLGVSSRGTGNVGHNGQVSQFSMTTVDIVATPSAPDAYPTSIYEHLQRNKHNELMNVAEASLYDSDADEYLAREIISLINDLKQ